MSLRDEWLADPEPISYTEWLRRRTVPPTLLVLQTAEENHRERRQAERKQSQRKSRAKPGGRQLAHGSTHGWKRHRAAGEDPCAECVAGHEAEKQRRAAAKRANRGLKRRQPPQCGSPQAARRHRRLSETVCEACKQSERDEWHNRAKKQQDRRAA